MRVEVTPADARVSVDGRPLDGPSPLLVDATPGATLAIHVERAGYEAVDRPVAVEGDEMAVAIDLRPEARNLSRGRPKPPGKEVVMPPKEAKPAAPKRSDKDQILMPEDN